MLTINASDIVLNQQAANKVAAIELVAAQMAARGLVAEGYGAGMQSREKQAATYLGNGIAIPHGTIDTRDQVKQTGVQVMHFPHGVAWGDEGQLIYIAVGIAASGDEHLGILKQLTRLLGTANLEASLLNASSAAAIAELLNGAAAELAFDTQLIDIHFPARTCDDLLAASAGLLSHRGLVDAAFVTNLIRQTPTYLADGIWLATGNSAKQSAVSVMTVAKPLEYNDAPVNALITVAAKDDTVVPVLQQIANLLFDQQLGQLLKLDAAGVFALLNQQPAAAGETRTFTILNHHGLHARPSAMLAMAMKPFSCDILVANASTVSAAVDGRKMPNIMGLGLKHGEQITITANGDDAAAALDAIGAAIAAGLGENLE